MRLVIHWTVILVFSGFASLGTYLIGCHAANLTRVSEETSTRYASQVQETYNFLVIASTFAFASFIFYIALQVYAVKKMKVPTDSDTD